MEIALFTTSPAIRTTTGITTLEPTHLTMPPRDLYSVVQANANRVADEFCGKGEEGRFGALAQIERHLWFGGNPLSILEGSLVKTQRRVELGRVGQAVVRLGHAVFGDDASLFHAALEQLESLGDELNIGSPGFFGEAPDHQSVLLSPRVPLDVLEGEGEFLWNVHGQLTMLESLAIYGRVWESFRGQNIFLLSPAAFYEILEIERCFARDQGLPLDLVAMTRRLLQANAALETYPFGAPYPDVQFEFLPGSTLSISLDSSTGLGFNPQFTLSSTQGEYSSDRKGSDLLWRSYIRGTLRGASFAEAVERRAKDLALGSALRDINANDPDYAVEMRAIEQALHHPALKISFMEWQLRNLSAPAALSPDVHSQPFSFDVTVQKPLQRTLNMGLIEEHKKRLTELTSVDVQAYFLVQHVENYKQSGLQAAHATIQRVYQEVREGHTLLSHLMNNERRMDRLIDEILTDLAKSKRQVSGIQALPYLLFLKALRMQPLQTVPDVIANFRPTMPFDEAVRGLLALHEFYADMIPHVARSFFGPDFSLPGRFLREAADHLGKELEKVSWMDSQRVHVTILPSRDTLDSFHAHAGDRNCLIGDPRYPQYSLTDPRFNPHRILVGGATDSETWNGGIYQMTSYSCGQKLMILSGIDPRTDFHVNPGEFLDGLEQGFGESARAGGYDLVLVHSFEGSSRKGTILREITARYRTFFVLPDEDVVGFPLRAAYPGHPPRADESSMYHLAHRDFLIMHDFRGKEKGR